MKAIDTPFLMTKYNLHEAIIAVRVNTIPADILAANAARASAGMGLTQYSRLYGFRHY